MTTMFRHGQLRRDPEDRFGVTAHSMANRLRSRGTTGTTGTGTDLGPLPIFEEMDEGLIQKYMKKRKGRMHTYGESDYLLSPSSLSKKTLLGS